MPRNKHVNHKFKKYSRSWPARFSRYLPRFAGAVSGAALGYIHNNIPGAISGGTFGYNAGTKYAKRNMLRKRDFRRRLGSVVPGKFYKNTTGSNPGHVFGSNPGNKKVPIKRRNKGSMGFKVIRGRKYFY